MIGLEYILQITGKSHTELANNLGGIARQNINQWVKGKSKIPKKYLPILSKMFNIPEDIFQEDLNKENQIIILKIILDKLENEI